MKHVAEPLDYLYEELPPEAMAEARAHLAECPKCREEMRKIRGLVKLYREGGGVRPPAGLAARAAAAALAARDGDAGETLPPHPGETPDPDRDFERIKREVCGEIRSDWRARLFHPAWTVAASVIFICAVLIHVSPRNRIIIREPAPPPAATFRLAEPARQRLRLPEAPPRRAEEAGPSAAASAPPPRIPASLAEGRAVALPHAEESGPRPPEPVMAAPAAAAPAQGRVRGGPEPVPPEMLERYAADSPPEALFMDISPALEPPQVVARPTPLDVQQSIRNLTALAGMQIGGGEYDEARATIELLRRHDARQADAMSDLLEKAEAAAVAGRGARAAEDEPPAEAAVSPDKYSIRPSAPAAIPEPARPEPQSGPAAAPGLPEPEPSPESAPLPEPEPAPEQPESSVLPSGAVGEGVTGEVEPSSGIPVSVLRVPVAPEPEPGPPSVPVVAPTVPKPSPDAVPPTLWESTEWRRDRPEDEERSASSRRPRWKFFFRDVLPPSAESLPDWRRTRRFTTDPYFRDAE